MVCRRGDNSLWQQFNLGFVVALIEVITNLNDLSVAFRLFGFDNFGRDADRCFPRGNV